MYGTYEHTVDAKGRMNFPAKLLKELGEHFYISKSLNVKCLMVYTEEGWEALMQKLKGMPQKKASQIQRFIFGGACEAEPDKQGRIAIAQSLRTFAGISGEVVVLGVADHAEIWDKTVWEEYNSETDQAAISAIAEELDF